MIKFLHVYCLATSPNWPHTDPSPFIHDRVAVSRDLKGVTPLLGALERIGGWPALAVLHGAEWNGTNYSWMEAAALAHLYTGVETGSPLVRLSVSIDERNATRHLLHVSRMTLC